MKASEFRKLIREEISKFLNEEEKLDTRGMNPTSARAYRQKDYIAISKNTKLKVGDNLLGIGNGMFAEIVKIVGTKIYIKYDASYADERPIVRDIKKMPERFLIQNPNKEDGYADKKAAEKPSIAPSLGKRERETLAKLLTFAIDPKAAPELKGETVSGYDENQKGYSWPAAFIAFLPEKYKEGDIEDFENWVSGYQDFLELFEMKNWSKLKDPQLAASYKEFDAALKVLGAAIDKLNGYEGFAQAYGKVVDAIKKFDKKKLASVESDRSYKFRLSI